MQGIESLTSTQIIGNQNGCWDLKPQYIWALGPIGEVLLCSWSLPGSPGTQWHNYRGGRNETYASFAAAKAPKALAELDTSKTGALSDTEFMQSVGLRSWHLKMVFQRALAAWMAMVGLRLLRLGVSNKEVAQAPG